MTRPFNCLSDQAMIRKRLIIFCLLLLFIPVQGICRAPSDDPGLSFDHVFDLGAPGGQTFLQDREGFLWIGSDGGGLFRYDGYELKNYAPGPKGLSNGNVWRIIQDREDPDIFWIGTSGGLNRFDVSTETFTRFQHEPDDPASLGDNTVQDLVQDGRSPNVLWLGTAGGGLNRFDKQTGKVRRYTPDPDDPASLAFPDVWRLIEDRADPNILWIGTYGGGLDRFEKDAETFTHFVHDPNDPDSLSARGNNIDALIQDRDDPNIIWIGTPEDGMNRFDKRAGKFTRYPPKQTNGEVALIHDDGRGTLWLGGYVQNNGLTLFDKKSGTFTNYKNDPDDPDSLADDLVVNVFESRSGIIWITTYSGKVDKIDPFTGNFKLYAHRPGRAGSLSNSAVTALCETASGDVWIGTQNGLNRLDPETGAVTRYLHDPEDPDSLDGDHILGVTEDKDGSLWVSLYVGPLTRFDPQTGKVIARYKGEAESFTRVVQDSDDPDILWMGTHVAGFARFNKQTEQFTFYKPDPKAPEKGPGNTYIYEVVHDVRDDVIWLGGYFGGGLNRFDVRSETFTHYLADPGDPDAVSADAIAAIYQDAAGRLWIGTKGGGLDRFDRDAGAFVHYNRRHGVPSEVNGIVQDNAGNLWLSTNQGIVRFDPTAETVDRTYNRHDGLQGDAFLHGSALKTADGRIWFGGTNGVNAFYPDRLKTNPYQPPVVLTSLTRGGDPVDWGGGRVPYRRDQIRLNWNNSFFEFEFTALNYTIPEKNQYKYMLEGFDRDWFYSGTRRFGRYSNLPGGAYVLRIAGSNNDGVWSDQEAVLNVIVTPPWWKTLWFQVAMALFIAAALFAGFSWRVHAIRRRAKLLENLVDERTRALKGKTRELARQQDALMETNAELEVARKKAEVANRTKSAFLANMSHELRSPLTSIIGFTRLMTKSPNMAEEDAETLDIINRSAEHLLALISQILDLSKIEAGRISLNAGPVDLHIMLEDMANMFRLKAEENDIHFDVFRDEAVPRRIIGDELKLRQVLINLLSNAFKFTRQGSVSLRVRPAETDAPDAPRALEFRISDTGPGVAPEELETLFEAFVQTKTGVQSQEGAGLGLAISREFIRLMGGDISVESREGEGAEFTFRIAFEPAERRSADADPAAPEPRLIGLAPDQAACRILVADDKAHNRRLMVRLLEPVGFQVREASDGREAVDVWREWAPRLIWMDVRMPVMDGFEAVKKIRELETGDRPRCVIIALTASVHENERAAALAAGCDDFMRKPFKDEDILDMMRRRLGVRFAYQDAADAGGFSETRDAGDPAGLADLPLELTAALEDAALGGDVQKVEEVIGRIRRRDRNIGRELDALAGNFAYGEIVRRLKNTRKT